MNMKKKRNKDLKENKQKKNMWKSMYYSLPSLGLWHMENVHALALKISPKVVEREPQGNNINTLGKGDGFSVSREGYLTDI